MGYIYLLLSAFFWGTSFVAGKYAFEVSGPVNITFFRFFLASLLFIPTFYKNIKILNKSLLKQLLVLSFLMVPATFLLQFTGLKYTTVSSASIILGLEPFIVTVSGFLFWKVRTNIYHLTSSILVFIGVFLTFHSLDKMELIGSFMILLSTLLIGFWMFWSKNLIEQIKPMPYTSFITIFGTLQLLPFVFFFGEEINFESSFIDISWVIYLGIFCTFIPWVCWNKGVNMLSENISGLFLALEPIFGVIFGVILFQEKMNLVQTLGVLLVILTILISSILSHISIKRKAYRFKKGGLDIT